MGNYLFDMGHPDMPPMFHADDPGTSRESAKKHKESGNLLTNMSIVYWLVKHNPGLTACELWESATEAEKRQLVEMQEVRRRLSSMQGLGKVARGPERECRVRGTKQVTWDVL